jgi:hypothetical protein
MHNVRVGIAVGLVVAAFSLSVPVAVAADDPAGGSGVRIRPWNASPGSTVTVSTMACGPGVTYGKGESAVAGAFHLFEGDHEGMLTGRFTVPVGAPSGVDTVTVKCPPGIKITDTYQITARNPSGALDTGSGPADDSGAQLALGGVLLAGAAAGGMFWMRRRPSGART